MYSERAVILVKRFEGCRLEAYQDQTGKWTIGYGHTPATPHQIVTQEEAETLLREDLQSAAHCVNLVNRLTPLTQNQFDALCSFVFNVGCALFLTSTLHQLIEGNMMQEASEQFPLWCHEGSKVIPGLLRRRKAEQELFNAVQTA